MSRQDVIVRMRLAGEDFERDFKLKFEELEKVAEQKSGAAGARGGNSFAKGFIGAAGMAGLGAAIGAAISKSAALGDQIISLGRQFNMGAESIQVWQFAAQKAGVSSTQLTSSLGNLTGKIGEAVAGNAKAQQSFVNLGLSFKTVSGEARNTDQVMEDLARKIASIEDPAERVRVGQQLLGKEFQTIYPLLLQAAEGTDKLRAELGDLGAMLSEDEIKNLNETNDKIENMKRVLSIRVASVIAENANALMGLANALSNAAAASVRFATEYPQAMSVMGGAALGWRFGGPWGAAAGGLAGLGIGANVAQARDDANMDLQFRLGKLRETQARYTSASRQPANLPQFNGALGGGPVSTGAFDLGKIEAELRRQTELTRRATALARNPQPAATLDDREQASVTGGGGKLPQRPARNATQSAADREAERAAKEAIRLEEQFRDAIARTLRVQQESAEVERVRAAEGEVAAAREEARLGFLRQHPLAIYDSVEALGLALGITKELTDADRQRLQLLIDQGKAVQSGLMDAAGAKAQGTLDRERQRQEQEAQRVAEAQARAYQAEMERAIWDISNIYEIAMRRGTRGVFDFFKAEGTRIIAEIAAQWTISMIAKQPFSLNDAMGGAMGRSPLGSIFFGSQAMAGLGGRAANDNVAAVAGAAGASRIGGMAAHEIAHGIGGTAARRAAMMQNAAFSLAMAPLGSAITGQNSTMGQIGGMAGSIGGMALGGKLAMLGSFGGPVGALAGAVIGSLLGGVLGGTPRGSVTVGNAGGMLGITGQRGSSSRVQASMGGANSLIDAIFSIAEQLGGGVDPSRGAVSFGVRKNSFVVDPTGRGNTKTSRGAINFGSDEQAAIRFAIGDLIRDGVLTGISQASQNLLSRAGTDLEKQIEKAMMIEQVPVLLRQRLDPLGFALDELFDKFKRLADAMAEGGATVEQIADARRLWELEKADTIASIGAASQTLKDFLSSLNAGPNSPLSLRQQRGEAESQLAPFLAQIADAERARAEVERLRSSGASAEQVQQAELAARTAAAAIDQSGFANASQLLLSISRASNASSGSFFSDFDRIRALTGQAIGFVDSAAATGGDTRDPFGPSIARNTADAAMILADHTRLLQAINDNLSGLYGGGGGGSGPNFIEQPRMYAFQ